MHVRVGAFELTKKGGSRFDLRDPYHIAITLTWPQFALLFLGMNLGINVIFALLFLLQPGAVANARPGVFSDVFFFSMETLATVGYGVMAPVTLYGHTIAAIEIITGMAFTAIMTGLTFVRFSRARAKIMYADKLVITKHHGQTVLMVRIANGRASLLTQATATVSAMIGEMSPEGQFFRRIEDLKLLRARIPIFPLTWTLMHPIDEASPFHGLDETTLPTRDMRLIVAISAMDRALVAEVQDMHDYVLADIVFGMRYADAVSRDEHGNTIADLGRISLLEPEPMTETVAA